MQHGEVRLASYTVAVCPHCGDRHDYTLRLGRTHEELLFAGPGKSVGLVCPKTKKPVQVVIELDDNERFLGAEIATGSELSGASLPAPQSTDDPAAESGGREPDVGEEAEKTEWRKASRTTATDFCKTMLASSTAAIPVYFAVLKYTGVEQLDGSLQATLGILPPVAFLSAAAVFAAALRPRLRSVGRRTFSEVRDERLRQLDQYMKVGASLFGSGLALATCLLFSELIVV